MYNINCFGHRVTAIFSRTMHEMLSGLPDSLGVLLCKTPLVVNMVIH